MPVKREKQPDSSSENEFKPLIKSPKKPKKTPSSPRKERKLWTEHEENQFKQAINNVVKKNIWNEIKLNFQELALSRGSDVVMNHWNAMYKKM